MFLPTTQMKKIRRYLFLLLVLGLMIFSFSGCKKESPKELEVKKLTDDPLYLMINHSTYYLNQTQSTASLPKSSSILCSTFFAKNGNDDYLTGRNFDFDSSPALIVVNDPVKGYDSISMVNLAFMNLSSDDDLRLIEENPSLLMDAYQYPLDGVNEKGVTMSIMESAITAKPMQVTSNPDISPTMAIRYVLDGAATTDEAVEILKGYDIENLIGAQYHYLIGDASGHSVVIEYKNNEMKVITSDQPYQECTNFMIQDVIDSGSKLYPCDRYLKIENKLNACSGIISADDAKQLLSDVRQDTTQWSCLYDNTGCSLEVSVSGKENDYQTISLDLLK